MLFDAHTHLNFEKYTDEERRQIASEIEASEVGFIIDVADCVAAAKLALKDSDDYPWCYAAVGIHPDHASDYEGICGDDPAKRSEAEARLEADLDEIRKLAAHPKAVAIGEIGLDYYYGTDDRDEQQELFRRQIRLANELKMPIMIHTRDAHQLTMDILKEEGAFTDDRKGWFPGRPAAGTLSSAAAGHDIRVPGEYTDGGMLLAPDARVQMHCFSGSPELALEYVKMGATISLGGPVTFKNGKKAAEVVRQIPIEYLLSETDAPYMAPEPLRGRPNKSPYIEHIVRRMAILKGLEYDEAARILTENGRRFFNIR
jgi:TatD DNase family protein